VTLERKQKERLPQLNIYRAFAILGVLHVHGSSYAAGIQALDSPYYYVINFMNIFFKFGTPSFIFLSSFILFYNYFDRQINRELITRFYRRRLTAIILPYLMVSIGYFVFVQWINGDLKLSVQEQLADFAQQLLTGSAYSHLYFVFISIQFYILFPFLLKLLQSSRKFVQWAIPVGFLIQWGFIFWNKYQLHIVEKGSLAFSYFVYFMMGAYIAVHFDRMKEWLTMPWNRMTADRKTGIVLLWTGWMCVSLIHTQLWFYSRLSNQWIDSLWYELFWNMHTILSAIILMRASFQVYYRASPLLLAWLSRLGELSFAIYLIHPLVLLIYRRFRYFISPESFIYVLWIYGGMLAALVVTWWMVQFAFKRIPFSTIFLGSAPESRERTNVYTSTSSAGHTHKAEL
jgi:peptidoglycan/LPS O-acetylase OafA/YrhL